MQGLYAALRTAYGEQPWWPADSPFEVMVGAVLTQNAAWTNVEKAIAQLKAMRLLDPDAVLA
ncbi:MAG: endonuclease, partial [Gammaproteobacteria bacterium]|nr:endonuclease [Gammaproteobacteria bacterium]